MSTSTLFTMCLLFGLLQAQADWKIIKTTPYPLQSVHFSDRTTGYAVGMQGSIIKTSDGGKTWASQNFSGRRTLLTSVYSVTPNIAYVTGWNGTIAKTSDGGETWRVQSTNTPYTLWAVYFLNADVGFAVGDAGTVLKTVTGGQAWETLKSGSSHVLTAVAFRDEKTGYIVDRQGVLLKTSDGGELWHQVSTQNSEWQPAVKFTREVAPHAVEANAAPKATSPFSGKTGMTSVYSPDKHATFATSISGSIFKQTDNPGSSNSDISPRFGALANGKIWLDLPRSSPVKIISRDLRGRLIGKVVEVQQLASGYHTFKWISPLHTSGIYFIELRMPGFRGVTKAAVP